MKAYESLQALLLPTFFLWCVSAQALSRNGPDVGDKPPLLRATKLLQAPPGAKLDAKALRGKVVVLEFWATWCGPCVASIPHLNELAKKFKGQPVQFVAITDEKESVVKRFLSKRPINAWVALDTDKSMHKAYGIAGIPHTVLIGKDGKIAAITHPRALTAQHIKDLLAGEKIALRDPEETEQVWTGQDLYGGGEVKPLFEVLIRPSAWTNGGYSEVGGKVGGELTARGCTVWRILPAAFNQSSVRILTNTALPTGKYDFFVTHPRGGTEEVSALLQQALKSAFGLTGKRESRETDVLILKVKESGAPGLVVSPTTASEFHAGPGEIGGVGVRMPALARALESVVKKPVFDETGLTNRYDISLKWDVEKPKNGTTSALDPERVKKAVREQLGLDLVPERRVMEMVVIGRAKEEAK